MIAPNRLYTTDEFEEFIALPENSDRRFELIYGEIVEKMPTEEHGFVAGNIVWRLNNFVKPRKLGRLLIEVRHALKKDRLNDRIPDISFTSTERAGEIVKQGPVLRMPELAIEIQSPDDSQREMREKAAYYLQHGSRLVWLIYTDKPGVDECTLGADGEMLIKQYGMDDILDGGEVLPGFTLPVRDIFDVE
jgi:Uma2 family endonuclease